MWRSISLTGNQWALKAFGSDATMIVCSVAPAKPVAQKISHMRYGRVEDADPTNAT